MEPVASNKVATASQRQQLQHVFDRGLRLKDGDRDQISAACELFRHCFASDPGNLIYTHTWLSSIDKRKRVNRGRRLFAGFLQSSSIRKAERRRQWSRVIERSSRCITTQAANVDWFLSLADACDKLEHRATAILILRHAARQHDQNDQVFRRLAAALAQSGDFSEARRCWHQVHELCAGDDQSRVELAKLGENRHFDTSHAAAARGTRSGGELSVDHCIEQVDSLVAQAQFDLAEEILERAMSQLGNDIRLRERAEQSLVDHVLFDIGIARRRLDENPSGENQQLLEGLQRELNRREIDFFAIRSARYPEESELQLELGRRLKTAGIFAEAVAEFAELLDHPELGPVAAVETGECWQSLRQFDRALGFYRAAIKSAGMTSESFKRSRYRAAILIEAMGNRQRAEQLFSELLQVDPGYKDAAVRLDKIQQIRHDM